MDLYRSIALLGAALFLLFAVVGIAGEKQIADVKGARRDMGRLGNGATGR